MIIACITVAGRSMLAATIMSGTVTIVVLVVGVRCVVTSGREGCMGNHRRLTRLEIKLLGQKLAVAEISAENSALAIAAKALIYGYLHAASLGRDLHQEDIVRIMEEAFRTTKYRLENLEQALSQARTGELLLQQVISKRRRGEEGI
jgi:hypothetical protein